MAILGSQLPDIDTTTSTVGKICYPVSSWIEDRFPHRSITHSLLATAGIAAVSLGVNYFFLHGSLKAAIAFNPGKSQADSSINESSITFENSSNTRKRHKINLNISSLEDIKVVEGDRIDVGDIISDRTTERTKLQAKQQRLSASLSRAKLPLRELKPVPEPKFQTELAALKQAQFQLDAIALPKLRTQIKSSQTN